MSEIKFNEEELESEEWRKIDFPFGKYSVSSLGRVRNDETGIFKKITTSTPYPRVLFRGFPERKGGIPKLVHVLVAQQFLGYTPDMQKDRKIVVHHKDSNKLNYRLDNLEIISAQQNNLHAAKDRKKQTEFRIIQQFNVDGDFIAEYPSQKSIEFVGKGTLLSCLNGRSATAGGFIWKYKPAEEIQGEEWKTLEIDDFEINVSNKGRVQLKCGKIVYGSDGGDGYLQINRNKKHWRVHRLVCQAFKLIENSDDFVVNHIDENRKNNCVENLEWTTQSGNLSSYYYCGDVAAKLESFRKEIVRIKSDGTVKNYDAITSASKQMNISRSDIIRTCQGKMNHAGGYKWMYFSDYEEFAKDITEEEIKSELSFDILHFKGIKKIVRISLNGEIKFYDKIEDAVQDLNINQGAISSACRKPYIRSAYGYKWMYAQEYEQCKDLDRIIEDLKRKSPVVCITPDGEIKKFKDVSAAGRILGINGSGIGRKIKIPGSIVMGHEFYYECDYEEFYEKVKIYNENY